MVSPIDYIDWQALRSATISGYAGIARCDQLFSVPMPLMLSATADAMPLVRCLSEASESDDGKEEDWDDDEDDDEEDWDDDEDDDEEDWDDDDDDYDDEEDWDDDEDEEEEDWQEGD